MFQKAAARLRAPEDQEIVQAAGWIDCSQLRQLDRFGILSFDAWRACRLVVDTGLHAFSWSRRRAIEFMLAHTALAQNNIENEVDRYIAWPGQATAYKTGQLEIFRLRAAARERLGAGFDIKRFHDAVLGPGAVSLETLGEIVRAL